MNKLLIFFKTKLNDLDLQIWAQKYLNLIRVILLIVLIVIVVSKNYASNEKDRILIENQTTIKNQNLMFEKYEKEYRKNILLEFRLQELEDIMRDVEFVVYDSIFTCEDRIKNVEFLLEQNKNLKNY